MLFAPAPGLGLFAALGAFAALRRADARRLAIAGVAAALVPFAMITLTESSERYVGPFLPLWVAGVIAGVDATARAVTGRGSVLARTLLAAFALAFGARALAAEARESAALRAWLGAERAALATRSAAASGRRLLFSDTPDFAAWTTGRPTIAVSIDGYRAL